MKRCKRQRYLTQEAAEGTARLLRSRGIKAFSFRCCVAKHFHVETPNPHQDAVKELRK